VKIAPGTCSRRARGFSSLPTCTSVPISRIVEMPPPTAASVKATSIECMLTHTSAIRRLYTPVRIEDA
jgi:hypothetical protein